MIPRPNDYKIEQIDILSEHERSTFLKADDIKTVLMQPGDSLWRFTHSRNGKKFSDCWIDAENMKFLTGIFVSRNEYTQRAKTEPVKNNLGVMEVWFEGNDKYPDTRNQMLSYRIKITFKQPVIAYTGILAPQSDWEDTNRLVCDNLTDADFIKANIPISSIPRKSAFIDNLQLSRKGGQIKRRREFRIGGLIQYVIPRFKDISGDNDFATVVHQAHI